MEIDTIKDLWNAENPAETPEISIEKQKEIRMPLEKIRKNMQKNFWSTVVGVICLILTAPLPFIFENNERLQLYYSAFLITFLIIITFYFLKFLKLYQDLEVVNLTTKDSLKDLLWKFELFKQNYHSYYIAAIPTFLFELAIFKDYLPGFKKESDGQFILSYISTASIGIGLMYFSSQIFFRHYFGKYIYKIKKTLQIIEIHENAVK